MGKKPETKSNNSLLAAILFLIGIVAVDVLLLMNLPSDNAAGALGFIFISLAFAALLVIAIVYGTLQKRMVQQMKTPLSIEVARETEPAGEETTAPPLHPFEYQLFDHTIPIHSSPKASAMFEQANAQLQQFKLNLILGKRIRRRTAATRGMRLLILWVFGAQHHLLKILGDIGRYWRYLGSVQFLQGGEYTLNMSQVLTYMGGNRRLIVQTPEQLEQRLGDLRYEPDWSGLFPAHSLLCGDAVWKLALDAFLNNADLVAMNLSGFSRTNQGCLYELRLLTNRFPTQRTLLLVDDTTDMEFLIETLHQNWSTMSPRSPNYTETPVPVSIYKVRPSNPDDNDNLLRLFFEIAASSGGEEVAAKGEAREGTV